MAARVPLSSTVSPFPPSSSPLLELRSFRNKEEVPSDDSVPPLFFLTLSVPSFLPVSLSSTPVGPGEGAEGRGPGGESGARSSSPICMGAELRWSGLSWRNWLIMSKKLWSGMPWMSMEEVLPYSLNRFPNPPSPRASTFMQEEETISMCDNSSVVRTSAFYRSRSRF